MSDKPRIPAVLDRLADDAVVRLESRPSPPRIRIEKTEDGDWRFASPYAPEDEERWLGLLFDAFGTRHGDIVNHFLEVITTLCRDGSWNKEQRWWTPKE